MPVNVSTFFESRGFRLQRELGRGGMGVVYLATQISLSRDVALKVLLTDAAGSSHLHRLRGEALVLRAIQHRNVVRLLDVSLDTQPAYIVFEYVAGSRTLADFLLEPEVPLDRRLAMSRAILEGLSAIHEHSVVHRDLKPANILIDPANEPLLIDFGLARALTAEETRHTGDGMVVGTVAYMAPEQLMGEDATLAADVYSWALIAYELLAGRGIFSGGTSRRVQAVERLSTWTPDLHQLCPTLDPRLDRLLADCLDRTPARRPPSARAVLARWPTDSAVAQKGAPRTERLTPFSAAAPARRSRQVPVPPAIPTATTGRLAPILAILVIGLITIGWRMTRPRTGTPASSQANAPPVDSAPRELRLEVRASELLLTARTAVPLPARVTWKSRDTSRSRSYPATNEHTLVLGGPDLSEVDDIAAMIGTHTIDLVPLAEAPVRELEQALKHMPVRQIIDRLSVLRAKRRSLKELRHTLTAALEVEIARVTATAAVARQWLLRASLERRTSYLRAVYQLELLNGYLTIIDLAAPASSQTLLPAAWRMRGLRPDGTDNPRSRLSVGTTKQTTPWVRLDGNRLTQEQLAVGGAGWRYLALWVNSGGGYKPDKLGDALFGEAPKGTFSKTSWNLEFEIPAEYARASEVSMIVYAQETGQGVLWADINGRLEVPFGHPVGGQPHPRGTTLDWIRAIPPGLLRGGRNTVVFNLRPYPALEKVDPIWIGWLYLIFYSAEFN